MRRDGGPDVVVVNDFHGPMYQEEIINVEISF
jgi:hypothetical protein